MKKVVINSCYGGFGLSPAALRAFAARKGRDCFFFEFDFDTGTYVRLTSDEQIEQVFCFHAFDVEEIPDNPTGEWINQHSISDYDIERADPDLVAVVEELGKAASSSLANLTIVEIPSDVEFIICEYDGHEHVAEAHRTWS